MREHKNLVGKEILMNGRRLAVKKYESKPNLFSMLILKNVGKDEMPEGSTFLLTPEYIEENGYEIVGDII
jgi:hypothetical protein